MIDCSLRKALCAQPINQFPFFLAFKWGVRSATVLLAHHFVPECLSLTWERSTCIGIYQGLQTSVMIFGLTTPASNVVSIRCILMAQPPLLLCLKIITVRVTFHENHLCQ